VSVITEATRTVAIVAVVGATLVAMIAWLSVRALRLPPTDPNRLVAELRLAQLAAVVLAFVGAAYVGLAAAQPAVRGGSLDVALALGFLIVAATAPLRDPREALTMLALAFVAHAVGDALHRPGWLPDALVPGWYAVGCAVQNSIAAALCYLPVLRR
jgi:hypothetical protein